MDELVRKFRAPLEVGGDDNFVEKMSKFAFAAPNGDTVALGLSAGIAIYPIHAITASNLLRAADEALYRAKRQQRGSYMVARGFTGELRGET